MTSVNIIAEDNASGLSRDAQLLQGILDLAGYEVTWYRLGKPELRHKLRRLTTSLEQAFSQRVRQRPLYDINLFVERVVPRWLPFARYNLLLPNQEWFRDDWTPYLAQFDAVLCKTRHAEAIFAPHSRAVYVGFTGSDRRLAELSPDYDRAFHLASRMPRLGTHLLLKIWRDRPDFPPLTLIRHYPLNPADALPNLNYIGEFVSETALLELQNQHGVHIYPTEVEGFGHRLSEAMSCAAATVTTDAPPMNELVTPDRGMLVPYGRSEPRCWGERFFVEVEALTQTLESFWGSDISQRRQWGEGGRAYFEESDRAFRQRLAEVLQNLGTA